MAGNRPAAEVDVDVELVRSVLGDQHPDLAELPLSVVASGWDDVVLRVGDDLAVRALRRPAAAALVVHEQTWLPLLAPRLRLPIPVPVRVGAPAAGYPWAWSVVPWFEGAIAAEVTLHDAAAEARRLGGFLSALHEPAPDGAPANPFRGGPIADHVAVDRERAAVVDDGDRLLRRLRELVDVEPWTGPPVWLHGDCHTANLLVDGRLGAVIDFGDVCAGDPATDLAVAWMCFDPVARDELRATAGPGGGVVDDATWQRAEAWAVHVALAYLANSADDPTIGGIGRRLADEVLRIG